MHEVIVVSCIWCFSRSHHLCVAVGVMNCHLLCGSPALSWTVPLKCTPDPVNCHPSYQVPQFILLYSSGCGSLQFKRFWPCDTQDLNLRLCQSREVARNIHVRQKEKSRHVWGAGDTGQHHSGALHSPGVGELLCLWQLHLSSLLQLLLSAIAVTLCVCRMYWATHACHSCSLTRSLVPCWECPGRDCRLFGRYGFLQGS